MAQLGLPASVVINMLYKQIIMTKSIPFLSIPTVPIDLDEIDVAEFDTMMRKGLKRQSLTVPDPLPKYFQI